MPIVPSPQTWYTIKAVKMGNIKCVNQFKLDPSKKKLVQFGEKPGILGKTFIFCPNLHCLVVSIIFL